MIDSAALRMVLWMLTGWLERQEREVVAYLSKKTDSYVTSSVLSV